MNNWIEYTGSDEQIAEMEYVRSRLNYNRDTGIFTWASIDSVSSRVKIGSMAGTVKVDRCGIRYLRIYVGCKRYYAHRLAWMFANGKFPDNGMEIDHIDGNGMNNSINNLRCVDKINNQRNKRISKRNTSGKLGVFFCNTSRKWTAQIGLERHRKHLGHFDSLDEAIQARSDADIKYGFHENHGETR